MSLVSNASQIAFASDFPVDKIVGVWEGTYNRATDVTTRTYTFLGSPYNVYVYRIAHGFTRPVFCDLLWSTDGTTYADGGSGATTGGASLAWSDSTYIYIYDAQGVASAGTAHYKVVAFWIDSYDGTDPLVPTYSSANKTIGFDSRENYQKIYLQNVVTVTNSSGSLSTILSTVLHGLSYLPNHRVYFEAFSGEVWPAVAGGASNLFLFADNEAECQPYVDTNLLNLLVTLPAHQSARVWYRVYLDI